MKKVIQNQLNWLFTACVILSSTALAQSPESEEDSAIAGALPSIICLLLCEEQPVTTPPVLNDVGGITRLFQGIPPTPIEFNNTGGGGITDCQVSPALPNGLSVRVSSGGLSCEIFGTPTGTSSNATYTITTSNPIGSDTATISIEVLASIEVSGRLTYDLVPTATGPVRLNYNQIEQRAIRAATVELLDASDSVLQTTTTNLNGDYSFLLPNEQDVRIRVRAELLKATGVGRYHVRVVDNTNGQALYTMAEVNASSAIGNQVRDLNASSGWGTSSYISARVSAPFAMLDTIYGAITDVLAVDNDAIMPLLTVNWSVNNRPTPGSLAAGNISTSFYSNDNLYILGDANNDTDEFDDHVIVHEWGHYFEDNLSRSDSVGGPHTGSDRLDMRVAFGEGFGNALSGMITDDPLYIDTFGLQQGSGFSINVESNPSNSTIGWYNESSVQSILYDLYDSNNDGSDTVSLGFAPIYEIFVNEQRNSPYFTSIFTYISALKSQVPEQASAINTLVNNQDIDANTISPSGATETNNAGVANVLPVYTQMTVGSPSNVCTITNFNGQGRNKLSNYRYLEIEISTAGSYEISAVRTSATGINGNTYGDSDPDFIVQRDGLVVTRGESGANNQEVRTTNLSAGKHVLALLDWNIGMGARGTACFDVTVAADN